MLRFVNICLVLGLVALAYVIYEVKYEARGLDETIAGLGKEIETERDAVAELRAEWSLLNRPERIQRLAEKYLKLAPAQPRQLVTLDTVSESDFVRLRTEAADQTVPQAPVASASLASDSAKTAKTEPVDDDSPESHTSPATAVVVTPIEPTASAKPVSGKPVSGKPVPAKAVPAKIDPARADPVKTAAAKPVPVKTVKTIAVKTVPVAAALPPVTVSDPDE
jgi:cell division protein FtsL